jgi:uncharacterized protein (DUF2164 family)
MTTATETKTTDLHTARTEIEAVLSAAATYQWEEIAASIEEHGAEATMDFLKGYLAPHYATQRLSSRSTSMISNLLDDMKYGIYTSAYFTIQQEIAFLAPTSPTADDMFVQVAKEVRRVGRHYAANI